MMISLTIFGQQLDTHVADIIIAYILVDLVKFSPQVWSLSINLMMVISSSSLTIFGQQADIIITYILVDLVKFLHRACELKFFFWGYGAYLLIIFLTARPNYFLSVCWSSMVYSNSIGPCILVIACNFSKEN